MVYIIRPVHREEKFEEEVLEEDEAEVNLSKLDEEILEVATNRGLPLLNVNHRMKLKMILRKEMHSLTSQGPKS